MKYTIEQIGQGEDELILRYQELNQEVEYIMNFMSFPEKKLVGFKEGTQIVIDVKQILYIESVDRKTFVYLENDIVRVEYTLAQLEKMLFDVFSDSLLLLYLQMGCKFYTGRHHSYAGNGSFGICNWLDTEFATL